MGVQMPLLASAGLGPMAYLPFRQVALVSRGVRPFIPGNLSEDCIPCRDPLGLSPFPGPLGNALRVHRRLPSLCSTGDANIICICTTTINSGGDSRLS